MVILIHPHMCTEILEDSPAQRHYVLREFESMEQLREGDVVVVHTNARYVGRTRDLWREENDVVCVCVCMYVCIYVIMYVYIICIYVIMYV